MFVHAVLTRRKRGKGYYLKCSCREEKKTCSCSRTKQHPPLWQLFLIKKYAIFATLLQTERADDKTQTNGKQQDLVCVKNRRKDMAS